MSNPLRIIFMGTPEFAVPSLQALIDNGEDIACVVCQPDRPKGRGRKLTPPPVKALAQAAGIDVLQPTKIKTETFLSELKNYSPDLLLVAAYGRILPESVLNLPRLGCINVHGSLLPKYRGAAPIQWAILNGESETGVTIMNMEAGLDTGDMLLTGKLPISQDDTTATLFPKLAQLGSELLIEIVAQIRDNTLTPIKQDDSQASLAPPLKKEDGTINWNNSAASISCQIRGLDPWPIASTTLGGKRLRLFKPEVFEEKSAAPGTICRADKNGLVIACGRNCLLIREVQKDGSKRMSVDSFLRGNHVESGTILH